LAAISIREFLEVGVHFGHQTKRWNPKMARYIFGERNGIYIIDLLKTVENLKKAGKFLTELVGEGGTVLFVGTKKQARDTIVLEATRCGMFYVNNRWLGGMLTNFQTIKKSVGRLKELKRMEEEGTFDLLPKKEVIQLRKEKERLEKNLSGIETMANLPAALFVVDIKREKIAVSEANKLEIPVVALVDTNCDPDKVTFCIPGNDDAIKSVKVLCARVADAILQGKEIAMVREQKAEAEKEARAAVPAPEGRKERTEDRKQRTGDRGQGIEDRKQKTGDKIRGGEHRAKDRKQKTEVRGQKTEDKGQRTEDGKQKIEKKAEDRKQTSEDREQKTESKADEGQKKT